MSKKGRRKRTVELIKTILIVLLSISAVYLTLQVQVQHTIPQSSPEEHPSERFEMEGRDTVHPVRMAATMYQGVGIQRYAVQYNQAESDTLFQNTYHLLVEVLSGAQAPIEIEEQTFQQALQQAPSLYYDWQGRIPYPVLNYWLSVENEALTGTVRHMVLSTQGDQVWLYYQDEQDGKFYVYQSDVVSKVRMDEAFYNIKSNQAIFAFENQEFHAFSPYTIILEQPPVPEIYHISNPLTQQTQIGQLLELLNFPETTNYSYDGAGAKVVRNENDTLRIAEDGWVSYEAATEGSTRYLVSGYTQQEAAEACRQLLQKVVENLCGEVRISLDDLEIIGEGMYQISFTYLLNDTQIYAQQKLAEFTVEQGSIVSFRILVRNYTDSGTSSVVLPERQAMAAMTTMGHENEELVLVYFDTGADTILPSWATAGELRGRSVA